MKRFFVIALFFLLASLSYAANESKCIYYFYGQGCPHCARTEPFINSLEQKYPGLQVTKFEVYSARENLVLETSFFNAFKAPIKYRGVPAVFTSNYVLVGDSSILANLEPLLQNSSSLPCPSLNESNPILLGGAGGLSGQAPEEISLWVVFTAALIDSINPCAIAVLLILLNALLASGKRERALRAGLAYITAIYIGYFLFGIGLFSSFQFTGLSYYFYQIVAVLALLLGISHIKDFFWYRAGGFATEIPLSWRPTIYKLVYKATNPFAAFLAGFAVLLIEVPCTGGPYFFILGMLAEKSTQAAALPILVFYNLVFVLPLLLILGLVYYGFKLTDIGERMRERNIRLVHLLSGILMLLLGFWALLSIFL